MILDTSALIAILLNEMDAPRIFRAIKTQSLPGDRFISSVTLVEAYTVIFAKKNLRGVKELELLCNKIALTPQPFLPNTIAIAKDAWIRYGKTSGHPAHLNFGDCFTYAIAKHRNDMLLCKGNDFCHTDIRLITY